MRVSHGLVLGDMQDQSCVISTDLIVSSKTSASSTVLVSGRKLLGSDKSQRLLVGA